MTEAQVTTIHDETCQAKGHKKMLGGHGDYVNGTGKSTMASRKALQVSKVQESELLQSILTEVRALRSDMTEMEDNLSKVKQDLDEKLAILTIGQSQIAGQLKEVLIEIPELKQDLDKKFSTLTTAQAKVTDQLREGFHSQWQGQTCSISPLWESESPKTSTKGFPWPGMARPVVSASVKHGVTRGTTTIAQSIQTSLRTAILDRTNCSEDSTRCTTSHSTSSGWNDIPPTSRGCPPTSYPYPHGMSMIRQPESKGTVVVPGSKEVIPVSSQSRLSINQAIISAAYNLKKILAPGVMRLQVDTVSSDKSLTTMVMIDQNDNLHCSSSDCAIENPQRYAEGGAVSPSHSTANGIIPSFQYLHRSMSNKNLSDKDILNLSQKMGDRWHTIGIQCLCFTVEDLRKIKADFSKTEDRIFEMLHKWNRRHQRNGGTVQKLLEDLRESEDVDLVILDFLRDRLRE